MSEPGGGEASVEARLAQRLERGEPALVATVVRTDGRPPSRAGAKLLVEPGAESGPRALAGTLGCSEFDAAALADAAAILAGAVPALRTYAHDLGSIEVYLEPYAPSPLLVVVGDTPVAQHLLDWAPALGFRTLSLPEGEALPGALGGDLYLLHTNHDSPHLPELLADALRRDPPARFLGLMGSRRHTGHHLDALGRRGFSAADLERIQSPVGLDLGARTPAEIALSMLAGLVALRRGAEVRWLDRPRPA